MRFYGLKSAKCNFCAVLPTESDFVYLGKEFIAGVLLAQASCELYLCLTHPMSPDDVRNRNFYQFIGQLGFSEVYVLNRARYNLVDFAHRPKARSDWT